MASQPGMLSSSSPGRSDCASQSPNNGKQQQQRRTGLKLKIKLGGKRINGATIVKSSDTGSVAAADVVDELCGRCPSAGVLLSPLPGTWDRLALEDLTLPLLPAYDEQAGLVAGANGNQHLQPGPGHAVVADLRHRPPEETSSPEEAAATPFAQPSGSADSGRDEGVKSAMGPGSPAGSREADKQDVVVGSAFEEAAAKSPGPAEGLGMKRQRSLVIDAAEPGAGAVAPQAVAATVAAAVVAPAGDTRKRRKADSNESSQSALPDDPAAAPDRKPHPPEQQQLGRLAAERSRSKQEDDEILQQQQQREEGEVLNKDQRKVQADVKQECENQQRQQQQQQQDEVAANPAQQTEEQQPTPLAEGQQLLPRASTIEEGQVILPASEAAGADGPSSARADGTADAGPRSETAPAAPAPTTARGKSRSRSRDRYAGHGGRYASRSRSRDRRYRSRSRSRSRDRSYRSRSRSRGRGYSGRYASRSRSRSRSRDRHGRSRSPYRRSRSRGRYSRSRSRDRRSRSRSPYDRSRSRSARRSHSRDRGYYRSSRDGRRDRSRDYKDKSRRSRSRDRRDRSHSPRPKVKEWRVQLDAEDDRRDRSVRETPRRAGETVSETVHRARPASGRRLGAQQQQQQQAAAPQGSRLKQVSASGVAVPDQPVVQTDSVPMELEEGDGSGAVATNAVKGTAAAAQAATTASTAGAAAVEAAAAAAAAAGPLTDEQRAAAQVDWLLLLGRPPARTGDYQKLTQEGTQCKRAAEQLSRKEGNRQTTASILLMIKSVLYFMQAAVTMEHGAGASNTKTANMMLQTAQLLEHVFNEGRSALPEDLLHDAITLACRKLCFVIRLRAVSLERPEKRQDVSFALEGLNKVKKSPAFAAAVVAAKGANHQQQQSQRPSPPYTSTVSSSNSGAGATGQAGGGSGKKSAGVEVPVGVLDRAMKTAESTRQILRYIEQAAQFSQRQTRFTTKAAASGNPQALLVAATLAQLGSDIAFGPHNMLINMGWQTLDALMALAKSLDTGGS